jgi:CheY-like chemotaxis protein
VSAIRDQQFVTQKRNILSGGVGTMQAHVLTEQRAQSILVVESDETTRLLLDLSLRQAGFAVGLASDGNEGARRLDEKPDLVIAAADDPGGLAFCRQAKQSGNGIPPAVVLISDSDVESKRRGLEAGADDFLARPIYVQEVVARAKALLQRRERERLEVSTQGTDRFVSTIEDVPLVDLLRSITTNQKSGVAQIIGAEGTRGEIFFRQGRVVDAEVGRLSGRDAVYRLFCWTAGRLEVEWKSIRRKDTVEMAPPDLLMEALRRVDDWRRLVSELPPLGAIYEVDYRLLAERLADIPDEVNRILRLFDGMRTIMQVIDDSGLPDLDAVAALVKLARERIIHDARAGGEHEGTGADMEGWLSDAAGPFRSPPRVERELFGAGAEPGAGVHRRPTAPLDPLGEGREAPDPEMRSRFTDRLEAEGTTEAFDEAAASPPPSGVEGAPIARPIEIPGIDSGPAPERPITLPGLGITPAEEEAPLALPTPSEMPGIQAALSPTVQMTTVPGDEGKPLPLGAEDLTPVAKPLRLVERTGDRGTDPGHAAVQPLVPSADLRSASGEITVRQSSVRLESAASEERLARLREESARRFVRPSQSTTPPGSARALDEPPPLAGSAVVPARRLTPVRVTPAPKVIIDERRVSPVDDDDEVPVPSRRRGLILVSAAALILVMGVWLGLRTHGSADEDGPEIVETTPAPTPTPTPTPTPPAAAATATAIVPMGTAPASSPETPTPTAGRRSIVAAPGTLAPHDDLDEHSADPKLARTRAGEAGPLLVACHLAFSEARMKDAEAACTAARDANPDSAEAYGLLAHALFNRNRRREALIAADRAVKLNPKLADAYVIIGGVHQDAGHMDEARRAYQRYLDLEPKGQYSADLRAIVGNLEPGKL